MTVFDELKEKGKIKLNLFCNHNNTFSYEEIIFNNKYFIYII